MINVLDLLLSSMNKFTVFMRCKEFHKAQLCSKKQLCELLLKCCYVKFKSR